MTTQYAGMDVDRVLAAIEPLPRSGERPALVVLVGALGSGKSTVADALRERMPVVVLSSDEVRGALVEAPNHSFAETQRVARAIRSAAAELLDRGITVVLDDANLTEWERTPLYSLAEQHGARLLLVEVNAPMEVVLGRLHDRHELPEAEDPGSAADVYHRMAGRREPIAREHRSVDTSRDITAFVDTLVADLEED